MGAGMSEDISIQYDELLKETEMAIQILIDGEKYWLPVSQIRHYEKNKKIYLPEWLAQKKGLI